MGRFTFDGKPKEGMDSEVFHEAMREAGAVECFVKGCGRRFGDGNKGQTLNVCIECLEYVCNDHLNRHPNCSEGR